MKLIGLYPGSYILKHKDERGFKLGRSRQTAKMAYNKIMKRYGEVKPGSKYHHVGKNVWRIYLIKNDRKRTGKTTEDKKKWGKQPHKWDFKGVDTKGSSAKSKKEIVQKTYSIEDLQKHLRIIARRIEDEGMQYSIISPTHIKFKNVSIKPADEKKSTVLWNNKEMKYVKTSELIEEMKPSYLMWVAKGGTSRAVYNSKSALDAAGMKWSSKNKKWYSKDAPFEFSEKRKILGRNIFIPSPEYGMADIYFIKDKIKL